MVLVDDFVYIYIKIIIMYIYALKCPKSGDVRYIGKTNNPKRRLQSHIDYARKTGRKRRRVSDWILGLLRAGLRPKMEIIENTTDSVWPEREKFWIKFYRENGFDLCNLTDGGESNNGYIYTDELREVRRLARIGYVIPDLVKKKISETLSIPVKCVDDNVVFPSIKSAIESSGVPKTTFFRKLHLGDKINGKTYEIMNKNQPK